MTDPLNPLLAISAIDGRYRGKVTELAPLVSEYGLMQLRVEVECAWFAELAACPQITELPPLDPSTQLAVTNIVDNFSISDAQRIKTIEATTNHDVKAVEYFVKEELAKIPGLDASKEFVHFACTSEDINNVSYALMLGRSRDRVLLPLIDQLLSVLEDLSQEHAALAMLCRTHGQPASPSTLGKEFRNVYERLLRQRKGLAACELLGKLNGAVGNYNAHLISYPEVDWPALSQRVLDKLGLVQNPYTTQIEPHDFIAEAAHSLIRFNTVLLDFDRDVWGYIAIEYFKQRAVAGETGSSTMPHKVNPIDFENSEGNLGIATALLEHLSTKLPVSRWQRDLSDSTVFRNLGSALAHSAVAIQATLKGLSRLDVNTQAITDDLDENWEILGEAVQTVMRRYGMAEPYERLKAATRGKRLDAASFRMILQDLDLPAPAQQALENLVPGTYIGLATELAKAPSAPA